MTTRVQHYIYDIYYIIFILIICFRFRVCFSFLICRPALVFWLMAVDRHFYAAQHHCLKLQTVRLACFLEDWLLVQVKAFNVWSSLRLLLPKQSCVHDHLQRLSSFGWVYCCGCVTVTIAATYSRQMQLTQSTGIAARKSKNLYKRRVKFPDGWSLFGLWLKQKKIHLDLKLRQCGMRWAAKLRAQKNLDTFFWLTLNLFIPSNALFSLQQRGVGQKMSQLLLFDFDTSNYTNFLFRKCTFLCAQWFISMTNGNIY